MARKLCQVKKKVIYADGATRIRIRYKILAAFPVLYLSVDPGKGFGPKPKFEFYLIPTSLADPVRLSGAFLNPCIRDG
jgi:hypothetical protein